jgi:polygalacturonase
LGKKSSEGGVRNVTVKTTEFTGTENGLRIKTWGRPSDGYVRGVLFEHALMKDVRNPIIINQNYCPHHNDCPNEVIKLHVLAPPIAVRFTSIHACMHVCRPAGGANQNPAWFQESGVKISGVTYDDIRGTSATPVAVAFDCSPSNPCSGITLKNVKLTYVSGHARSSCKHADGRSSGFIVPPSCL